MASVPVSMDNFSCSNNVLMLDLGCQSSGKQPFPLVSVRGVFLTVMQWYSGKASASGVHRSGNPVHRWADPRIQRDFLGCEKRTKGLFWVC